MKNNGLIKNIQRFTRKRAPEISMAIGIGGMLTAAFLTADATIKATKIVKENEEDIETKMDVVKIAWKPYVPALLTFIFSSFCIIEANSMHQKRNAALMTVCQVSKNALSEYRSKVIETIGENKERSIREKINQDKVDKKPVSESTVIVTEKGNTLCFDVLSGQYFKSDIDTIKRCKNDLNEKMLNEGYASLNELYYLLGIKTIKHGDEIGWNISDDGQLDISFTSQIAEDGTPCIVINYSVEPTYSYDTFYAK